jgi:hypothetical protein
MNSHQCRRKKRAARAGDEPAARDRSEMIRRKKARSMWSGLNPYQEETWRRQGLIYT